MSVTTYAVCRVYEARLSRWGVFDSRRYTFTYQNIVTRIANQENSLCLFHFPWLISIYAQVIPKNFSRIDMSGLPQGENSSHHLIEHEVLLRHHRHHLFRPHRVISSGNVRPYLLSWSVFVSFAFRINGSGKPASDSFPFHRPVRIVPGDRARSALRQGLSQLQVQSCIQATVLRRLHKHEKLHMFIWLPWMICRCLCEDPCCRTFGPNKKGMIVLLFC